MMRECEALSGYQTFVEKTREFLNSELEPKEAVKSAIDYCIKNNIMTDFFKRKRPEVEKVTLLDYTFERRLELVARDSKSEGFSEGEAKGFSEGEAKGFSEGEAKGFSEGEAKGLQKQLINLVHKGLLSLEDASSEAGMTVDEFKALL